MRPVTAAIDHHTTGRSAVPAALGLLATQMFSLQVGAAIAISLIGLVGVPGAAFARIAIACAIVGLLFRPRLPRRIDKSLLPVVALGAVIVCMNNAFFASLRHLDLGVATTIEFLGPLGVAVFTARRRGDVIWACCAAIGVALLCWGGSVSGAGVLLALAAAAARAAYLLLTRKVGRTHPRADGLFAALLAGTVLSLPLGLLAAPEFLNWHTLIIAAGVGLLSSAVPYACDLYTLRRIPAAMFGILLSLSPAVAALVGFLLLSQSLTLLSIAGMALVICASIGAVTGGRRASPRGKSSERSMSR